MKRFFYDISPESNGNIKLRDISVGSLSETTITRSSSLDNSNKQCLCYSLVHEINNSEYIFDKFLDYIIKLEQTAVTLTAVNSDDSDD